MVGVILSKKCDIEFLVESCIVYSGSEVGNLRFPHPETKGKRAYCAAVRGPELVRVWRKPTQGQ